MEFDSSLQEADMGIPDRMIVNGSDINSGLHIRYGLTDAQIQVVLEMKGHVDEKRLTRAVRLSTIAEPILGCRFVESPLHPIWQRRTDLDLIEWCSVEEIGHKEEALDLWLSCPLDLDFDPLVKVRILRSSANDTLCIKVHHACCDGVGSFQYASLLASIYNELSRNPAYQPQPNLASRDQSQMFLELGLINASFQVPEPHDLAVYLRPLEPCAAVIPFTPAEPKKRRQAIRRIPHWNALFHGYKQRGVTINDILLAAYWRALYQHVDSTAPEPLQIAVATDLRRYLPAGRATTICNFSGSVHFHLDHKPDRTLRDTVKEVSTVMKQVKNNDETFQNLASFLEFLARMPSDILEELSYDRKEKVIKSKKGFIHFSNVGLISKGKIYFGDIEAYDAYVIGPALCAPDFLLVVSTYQDWMTLNISFFESTLEIEWVDKLLDRMMEDLSSYAPISPRS